MGNEFCERFSYYGMRAILALYLNQYLLFNEDAATSGVHLFTAAAYTTTLLGAYLSDGYLGRYRTILYLSIIYVLGSSLMAFAAIPGVMGDPPSPWGAIVALVLIAVGTGGIKPCVSSFAGDQIRPDQEELLASVFALFYFFINSGSLLSTFLTPLFREYLGYASAFLLPAILLSVALVIFFLGRNHYRKVPPSGDVLTAFVSVIASAFREWNRRRPPCRQCIADWFQQSAPVRLFRRMRGLPAVAVDDDDDGRGNMSFLDYAQYSCEPNQVRDVKATLSAFTVFIPMPIYWSIYDQSASRWIFQASHMNLCAFGSNENAACNLGVKIQPDQMPILNPVLVLLLIPIFNSYIYPPLTRMLGTLHPLKHKMIWGMLLNAVAILAAAILQVFISANPDGVLWIWQVPQWLILSAGEVLVSITGLEFSFACAPVSMKSIVMAGWLLTTAMGNLIVAFVAESSFIADLSQQMIFFAVLMLLFVGIFWWVVSDFEYVVQLQDDNDDSQQQDARSFSIEETAE